jgi:adenine-specific DNA-methyltransferase
LTGDGYGLRYAGQAEARRLALVEPNVELRHDPSRSIRWDVAHDVLVEGDNLQAMGLLSRAYAGRVDLAYLDPPYNTGHDFVYRDAFAETEGAYLRRTGQADEIGRRLVANPETSGRFHSAWLSMMEPRLRLVHRLLAEHGLVFVSIDDHEVAQLRLLLDDVFGPDAFVAQIVVVGNRGGRDYLRVATTHEYLLVYGKRPDATIRELPRELTGPRREDSRGGYELRELRNRNPKFSPKNRPNLAYPVWVDPDRADADGACAVWLEAGRGRVKVEPENSRGDGSVWRWGRPKLAAAIVPGDPEASEVVGRQRRDGGWNIYEKHRKTTTKPRSLWDEPEVRSERGTQRLRELLGAALFDHPKPVELVTRCLRIGMGTGGIVLDPFAGAGTTADAVWQLNAEDGGARRSLSLQLPEPLPADAEARLHGHATIADVTRARMAAACPEGSGVRVFTLEPSSTPAFHDVSGGDPAAYLAALALHEDARRSAPSPDLWDLALRSGARLDAATRPAPRGGAWVSTAEGELLVWTAPEMSAADLRALGALPSGTHVACRATAPDDEAAALLVAAGCVLHLC